MLVMNTQKHRPVSVTTPLDDDVLIIRSMAGREQLGRPFEYVLDLFSDQPDKVKIPDILGHDMTVRLSLEASEYRYFNGHVSRFVQTGVSGKRVHYQATLVPWLWFLTRTSDCRIFQELTVPDIIKSVFRELGFSNFEESLNGDHYLPLKYCVQYRETAFNFVSRLMEEAGIYYHFKHDKEKHTLVLSDSPSSHEPFPGYKQIRFLPANKGFSEGQFITDWSVEHRYQPGHFALNDYNFEKPRMPLQTGRNTVAEVSGVHNYEIFDYPGAYSEQVFVFPDGSSEVKHGEKYAKLRMEAIDAQFEVASGTSDARGVCTGCTFELAGHPQEAQNHGYLVTSVSYQLDAGDYESGRGRTDGPVFSCRLTAINALQPFRPQLETPKPVVQGPQTAIVVGPAGKEIYTDKCGRVKVQFHWDRDGKADENSSCWMRVSQVHAGKGFGGIDIPRIGEEVIVSFLEGDPDCPIIIGRVYNGDNKPPTGLPSAGMVSGLKSNSTPGGGGYNEMTMDDTKGKEKIVIHGQYDMSTTVEHDHSLTVHNNHTSTVDGTHTEKIKKDTKITISEGKLEQKVNAGSADYYVKGKVSEKFDDVLTTTAKKDVFLISTTGFISEHAVAGKFYVTGDKLVQINSKSDACKVFAAKEILLSTGDSMIQMMANGTIKISGKKIEISGSEETKVGVGNQQVTCNKQKVNVSGAAINSSAVGMHELGGALIKIG